MEGTKFVDAVDRVLQLIAQRPEAHAIVLADIRRAVVRRYPYCVYYRAESLRVEVVSVFHTSRDPQVWQSRGD